MLGSERRSCLLRIASMRIDDAQYQQHSVETDWIESWSSCVFKVIVVQVSVVETWVDL